MEADKPKSQNRSLLIWILVLTAVNLAILLSGVALLVLSVANPSTRTLSHDGYVIPLPKDLANPAIRDSLFDKVKGYYNSGDNAKLLSMFGESYQVQIKAGDFDEQVQAMHNVAARIIDGAYSYYEFRDLGSGRAQFVLFFGITSPSGVGTLEMTFVQQGDEPSELYKIQISS